MASQKSVLLATFDDFPYDEGPVFKEHLLAKFQTIDSMKALIKHHHKPEEEIDEIDVCENPGALAWVGRNLPPWARQRGRAVGSTHPWDGDLEGGMRSCWPGSGVSGKPKLMKWIDPTQDSEEVSHAVIPVGQRELKIFQTTVPATFLPLLPVIINRCNDYAESLSTGWKTRLYSLTQQDIALAKCMPEGQVLALTDWIVGLIQRVYGNVTVRMDANQPHVLKYSQDHRGVPAHFDRCSLTVQIALNDDFTGGGTYFVDSKLLVSVPVGGVIMHPGSILHAGRNITSGTRYLLVWFCNLG